MSADDAPAGSLECHEVLARLSDYRDLPVADRRAVERHLADCERCARFGAEFVRMLDQLRQHLRTQSRGSGLREQIDRVLELETVAQERAKR